MATKKPLVLSTAGQIEQLQAADTLGGVAATQLAVPSVAGGTITKAQAVKSSADGEVSRAQATSLANGKALGLALSSVVVTDPVVFASKGLVTMTTAEWDAVTGGAGGLTPQAIYFLDPATAGNLTDTAPTTVGQVVTELGIALSDVAMFVDPKRPILL